MLSKCIETEVLLQDSLPHVWNSTTCIIFILFLCCIQQLLAVLHSFWIFLLVCNLSMHSFIPIPINWLSPGAKKFKKQIWEMFYSKNIPLYGIDLLWYNLTTNRSLYWMMSPLWYTYTCVHVYVHIIHVYQGHMNRRSIYQQYIFCVNL